MPRILLADDHPKVRHHLRIALEREGWNVCAQAATGREAIEMAAAHMPDVVILDLSMPELDGLAAAREIAKRFPRIQMLMLTMHDVPELAIEASNAGVRACVVKSNLQDLIDTIRDMAAPS
jgi:DNA-binding NarL/FixJ family response regulator